MPTLGSSTRPLANLRTGARQTGSTSRQETTRACFLIDFLVRGSQNATLRAHTERQHCNNYKDHNSEVTGGRAGKTERPKTSRPPGALVSTRAPSQPRASRVLSVTPPGPDRPAQTSPRALQGYAAGLTEASLTQSVGWQLNRRP